ncbi:MFS transporter [Streptomyces sp. NBC_01022]|uniref:MFS transporter n=1 Tax=Streptomyces sp. NBC_01022 TaxID=2903723 RepID=UPI002DD92039|nr:MFS transporter [Streptomyces sp. NBC_01022]WRZ87527.1 MFS transporter [Streptomyces sp. NBC_01022]
MALSHLVRRPDGAPTAVSGTRGRTGPGASPLPLTLLVALAPLLANADAGIVVLALPEIQHDLSMSLSGVHWVTNVYVLLVGGLQLLGGRLTDLVGARRLFLWCLAGFAAASAACGAAPSGVLLIVFRAAQAVCAALLVPSAMAILLARSTGRTERARALALWAGAGGAGSILGVLAGGVVVDRLDWRWAFYLSLPVALAALLAARRLCPPDAVRARTRTPDGIPVRGPRVDFLSSFALIGALLSLVAALVRIPGNGSAAGTWGLCAVSAALWALLAVRQTRSADPLLPVAVLRDRGLVAGAVGILLVSAATGPVVFICSIYLQRVHHYSPLEAGGALLPMVGGILLVGRGCARMLARHGPRLPCLVGCALVAAGLLMLTNVTPESGYLTGLLPGLALTGAGLPFIWMTCEVTACADICMRNVGLAAGVVQSAGQIGAALGLALVVTVCAPAADGSGAAALAGGISQAFWLALALMVPAAANALIGMRAKSAA